MVDREPWSVGKLDHGQTPRLHHSQSWSTMVGNEKPWYPGQTVTLNTFARYSEKCLAQIYRALYSDAMLLPKGTNMVAVQ